MRSLRGRLTLGITLALAVVLAGAGAMVSRYAGPAERASLDDRLERTAASSLNVAVKAVAEGVPPRDVPLDKVLAANGTSLRVLIRGRLFFWFGAPPPSARIRTSPGLHGFAVGGRRFRSFVTGVPVTGQPKLVLLEATGPLGPVERKLAGLDRRLVALWLASVVLGGCGTWFAVTLLLAPLRRLRTATSGIAGTEDLDQRVRADDGPSELRSLATSFNEMLARLGRSAADRERALAATRRFTSDAGHELRTPLTSVQATLSALSRHPDIPAARRTELVLDALAEHHRLVDLLDGLQAMARGDASPGDVADVELGDVVAASLDQARSRHPAVTWSQTLPDEPVWVRGWEPGLRLLVDNLLENAARHGRPDGHVCVSVEQEPAVVLAVEDDGPGIAPEDRERIFEPFTRIDATDTPGSGLGLALVRQQVRAHDAQIDVGESAGGGARFEVRFG